LISQQFSATNSKTSSLRAHKGGVARVISSTARKESSTPPQCLAFYAIMAMQVCHSDVTARSKVFDFESNVHSSPGITRGITGQTICMHASWGPAKHSQTTQSMVVHLRQDSTVITVWITGTAAPCTSIFKVRSSERRNWFRRLNT
jgi:hypothetical protein